MTPRELETSEGLTRVDACQGILHHEGKGLPKTTILPKHWPATIGVPYRRLCIFFFLLLYRALLKSLMGSKCKGLIKPACVLPYSLNIPFLVIACLSLAAFAHTTVLSLAAYKQSYIGVA